MLGLVMIACSKIEGEFNRHGIKEVSLILDAKSPRGKYFTEIVYFSSGKVYKRVRDLQADGTVKEKSERTGTTTKEEFQKLEDAVVAAEYSSQPDLGSQGSTKVIMVRHASGITNIDLERTKNQRVFALGGAISGVKIAWDGPPKPVD